MLFYRIIFESNYGFFVHGTHKKKFPSLASTKQCPTNFRHQNTTTTHREHGAAGESCEEIDRYSLQVLTQPSPPTPAVSEMSFPQI